MRVSKYFGIKGGQATFDFVDVHIDRDTPLFIDPAAIQVLHSPWAAACVANIQSYFQRVLDAITSGDDGRALALLGHLGEENATHLGYSRVSRGSGVGPGLAERFYDELSTSRAAKSGLITDLEDTALLIEGVREDRISDVTTNIIREQLVRFTKDVAAYYEIPLVSGVAVGSYWNSHSGVWTPALDSLPMANGSPLILVPKSIVRRLLFNNPSEYYRHYVLEFLRLREYEQRSSLVRVLKNGRVIVFKTDVEAKYKKKHKAGPDNPGVEKRINVDATEQKPDLLAEYKSSKASEPLEPTPADVIAAATGTPAADLDALLAAVVALAPGEGDAHAYEDAVEALLSAVFYPQLVNPDRQRKIHEGRKRIDIAYTNAAQIGFFDWLGRRYPAPSVFVECKNYSRPLANPEFDQLSGRFSPSRGKFGVLVYRSFSDKGKVLESLRDTAHDDRGYIVALDDDDLAALVEEAKIGSAGELGGLLHARFTALTD